MSPILLHKVASAGRHGWVSEVRPFLMQCLDLLFPPCCLLCQQELPSSDGMRPLFCTGCMGQLTDRSSARCPCCAMIAPFWLSSREDCPACRQRQPAFTEAYCLGTYAGLLRQAVLQLKKAQNEPMVMGLGQVLASRLHELPIAPEVDLVLPMPAHRLRRFRRWYNAAELLAEPVARSHRLELQRNLLQYIRPTRKQGTLTTAQRAANVRGAMRVRRSERLRGKHVLLVDDVMTTGSTANEAARICRHAGAASVRVAVIARGTGVLGRS